MGRTEYRIIEGKEYLVYINDEGCETVMGNPMQDKADALAKAFEDKLNERPIPMDTYEPHHFTKEMEDRLDFIDQQDYDKIIAYHEKAGHYKVDPQYGVSHYIPGTNEINPEWRDKVAEESQKRLNAVNREKERIRTIKGVCAILGVIIGILLICLFLHNYK